MKYPLETVRPFEYAQVTLADEIEVDCEKPDTIKKFLEHRVEDLIKKALRERPPLPGKPRPLPLIRIRVDYTGCPTISSQIFGQMFVGKVANPHDLLLWIRAPKRNRSAGYAVFFCVKSVHYNWKGKDFAYLVWLSCIWWLDVV